LAYTKIKKRTAIPKLCHYLPCPVPAHSATVKAPLTDFISEDGFEWCPGHEEALAQIKRLASKTPVLRPISDSSGELIFLFTNLSKVGAGALVGHGPSPETAILASFRSWKFAIIQLYYPLHELELLAIVDVVETFQPILYGTTFTIVTDNKPFNYLMK
jgi:hypothetical protein